MPQFLSVIMVMNKVPVRPTLPDLLYLDEFCGSADQVPVGPCGARPGSGRHPRGSSSG